MVASDGDGGSRAAMANGSNRKLGGEGGSGGGGGSVAGVGWAMAMATIVATIAATLVAMVVAMVMARAATRAAAAMAAAEGCGGLESSAMAKASAAVVIGGLRIGIKNACDGRFSACWLPYIFSGEVCKYFCNGILV